MKLNPSELSEILIKEVSSINQITSLDEIGYVIIVGDGIAKIYGLENAKIGEMIEFSSGVKGMVINLEEETVGAVIMGSDSSVRQGDKVKRSGNILQIPVSDEILGRVVDSLANPIDGHGKIKHEKNVPVEAKAPSIVERKNINQPMPTGIKVIDSLIPIGKGQRELIIGDRQTGKTAIAIDTIINQKENHSKNSKNKIHCIYVAIGQKKSTVAQIVKKLEDTGALEYTTVVAATASDPAPMQFLAPYTGCAIAEFFRDKGQHSLIIYDD